MTTEFFALGLFELAACFFVAIAAIANGPVVADGLILHYSAALATCLVVVSIAVGSYRGDAFLYLWRIGFKALLASLVALGVGAAFVILADGADALSDEVSRQALSRGCLACLALLLCGRMVFAYAYRQGVFTRRLVLLGTPDCMDRVSAALAPHGTQVFDLVARFDLPNARNAAALAQQCRARAVWGVVVAPPSDPAQQAALDEIGRISGARMLTTAALCEDYLGRIELETLTAAPHPSLHGAQGVAYLLGAALHRLMDVLLSLGLLCFALPVMLATAVAIRLESRGAVLYRQERVGQDGVAFTLYKFRSMRPDAEASGPVWARAQDNRVTRIGQFIRLSRIDELPQLINVLRGEMSFIGPRPERPVFVAQLEMAIPFYAARAQVKPGLTGWAQVNYPYGASVEDARMKLSYDLYYVKHKSLYLDVMILFSTIRVIMFQEGAR